MERNFGSVVTPISQASKQGFRLSTGSNAIYERFFEGCGKQNSGQGVLLFTGKQQICPRFMIQILIWLVDRFIRTRFSFCFWTRYSFLFFENFYSRRFRRGLAFEHRYS